MKYKLKLTKDNINPILIYKSGEVLIKLLESEIEINLKHLTRAPDKVREINFN